MSVDGKRRLRLKLLALGGLTAVLAAVFICGHRRFMEQAIPPVDALEIRVEASRYQWEFHYPRMDCRSRALVVPVDTPVRLTMTSTDVLHTLLIPAFGVQRGVLPDRYSVAWFEASEVGVYDLFCTESCRGAPAATWTQVMVVPAHLFSSFQADGCQLWGQERE